MKTLPLTVLISLLAFATVAAGQDAPPASAASPETALRAHSKMIYGVVSKVLIRAAEQMPEEHYAFKPADSVRTFGQIVGHVADAQYGFCSPVLGEKNPAPKVEKTKSSKADLIAALGEAVAYCNRAHDGMTNASATEVVKLMGSDMPKLGALNVNQLHSMEHYGNLVTYLRMKDIVPPTSDPEFMKRVAE